ncbi:hypothetical protein CK203_027415 [Vitis vinifera]|uniref:Uncharacterized protein n=1 Tax=Vitis vinifera TaxID=29760 RepID=A0A438J9W4_VITVI|nr:hypothetical protein CK203_027415 [Vitis vinifera]
MIKSFGCAFVGCVITFLSTENLRIRLVAVATQKFVTEVASDALQCHVKGETFKGDIGDYYQKYYRGNIFLLRGAKSLTLSVALSITFTERTLCPDDVAL